MPRVTHLRRTSLVNANASCFRPSTQQMERGGSGHMISIHAIISVRRAEYLQRNSRSPSQQVRFEFQRMELREGPSPHNLDAFFRYFCPTELKCCACILCLFCVTAFREKNVRNLVWCRSAPNQATANAPDENSNDWSLPWSCVSVKNMEIYGKTALKLRLGIVYFVANRLRIVGRENRLTMQVRQPSVPYRRQITCAALSSYLFSLSRSPCLY